MLGSLSLKSKLLFLCGGLVSVSIVVGVVARFTLNGVTERYTTLVEKTLPDMTAATDLYSEVRNYRLYLRTLMTTDMAASQKVIDKIAKVEADYDEYDRAYQALGFVQGQKEIYEKVGKQWSVIKDFGHKAVELYLAGKSVDLNKHLTQESHLADEYRQTIKELLVFHKKTIEANVAAANSTSTAGNTVSTIVISLGAFFGMFVGFLFSTQMAKTLNQLAIGLMRGAGVVASTSHEISNAGAELASAATEQAASLQETVASIEEISAMVARNSENATSSTAVAARSRDAAAKGKEVVESMIHSMDEINQSTLDIMAQTEKSNLEIAEIIGVINEIGNKTKVINEIVFQTKLLSFNASVEAARAGEHGKGFSVVAEEVGNLAQMSGNAAKEISKLLEGNIQKVESIVNNSKTQIEGLIAASKEKVDTGLETARQCGDVLDGIVGNVTDLFKYVDEIATASKEQSAGVSEISKAIAQLDEVTQKNSSASDSAAAAGGELTIQAEDLNQMVRTLVMTIRGRDSEGGSFLDMNQSLPGDAVSVRTPLTDESSRLLKKAG